MDWTNEHVFGPILILVHILVKPTNSVMTLGSIHVKGAEIENSKSFVIFASYYWLAKKKAKGIEII